ncbi:TetR/AcrR family transcriptional regulator C-terminal domain-containing protein [Amycolatopsis rhabdoformis]|uniref:TetR/AcrR family transcriptional regulator C-terminal domain-containing protein n=1 Tax=Amycolatopsis rhabdoformis TaxID=1448059 RepID=A0ABZ1I5N5_9PSEU|nr:TetR/AcrR family transcriptional regulator C-terminal domain-containing protein [Amycolatopsis rhabdoformis]WSE29744.1 TetR/AcrR family transcriptional regulator C-terminal domain-containing protein [Amycolatopsis rhabdoformis]
MVVFAGQGDARRSLELLWRKHVAARPGGPGPKPGLSVDAIVAAAVALADAEGMGALSMRAVGERLGRTAMALYTYVPGKSELVDLMYDHTLTELRDDHDLSAGWRPALLSLGRELWEFHLRHPWLLQVSYARPVLGPGEFRLQQLVLRVLFATGLPGSRVRWVVGALLNTVRGSVQIAAESRQLSRETGLSEEDWWYARAAVLGELVPDLVERYPLVGQLGSEQLPPTGGGSYLEREARQSLEAGLDLLLDGIETAIAREG